MIKEAILQIMGMTHGTVIKDDFGRQMWSKSGEFLNEPRWPTLKLRTLTALEDYLKEVHPQPVENGACLHIIGPTLVIFRGAVEEPKKTVDHYAEIRYDGSVFGFGAWHDVEDFIIQLQTQFVQDDCTAMLLKIVGNLSSDSGVKTEDDGVTQTVTAKTGITMVGNMPLPNPVSLHPYRTFNEIEQPKSLYVFRMRKERDGSIACALFDVGGNLWQLEATEAIKQWLKATAIDIPIIG